MVYIIHIIESFAGGSLDVVRALTLIKQTPQKKPISHIVIHGCRPDSPQDSHAGFDDDVQLIPWPFVSREMNLVQDFGAKKIYCIYSSQCSDATPRY